MRYKRESSFRYTFEDPLPALFQINRIDGISVETSEGEAEIIDVSPEGARLHSELNIPETDNKSIELSISFELNGKEFNFTGLIVWHKKRITTHAYGIKFLTNEANEDEKSRLVKHLKEHSKKSLDHLN